MDPENSPRAKSLPIDVNALGLLIARTQRESGEIPWHEGGKTDPWDLVEAAMGLTVAGCFREARCAFEWMAGVQLEDGSWYAAYRDGVPEDRTRDANMSAYIAVGVFHYYLVTQDAAFLRRMWKPVRSALDFVLSLQAPSGEIYWAISPGGEVDPMALLTGSSSIFMSLKCGLAIADRLGRDQPAWRRGLVELGKAIRHKPYVFNMTKARYSMDWFYPVLCGAVTGAEARKKIERHWKKFVANGLGVRCVSDRPWVTIAESCELVLALAAIGQRKLAMLLFNWIQDRTFDDGSFWCGFTFPDRVIWPEEKITWTNGVVLMAADALFELTPGSRLFDHGFWRWHAARAGREGRCPAASADAPCGGEEEMTLSSFE
ncbi:MAG: phenyltransferase domain-containing protein [bacterium]